MDLDNIANAWAEVEPTCNTPTSLPSDDAPDKRWFFDGALLLYRRKEYASAAWSYRLRLPGGGYERRSTGRSRIEDALHIASDRYHEVRWRERRGLSPSSITFACAAQLFVKHLQQEHELRRGKLSTIAKATIKRIERHLIPYFGQRLLSEITSAEVERFHEAYLERWRAGLGSIRLVQRQRTNRGRVYDTPLEVRMPGTFIRKPSLTSKAVFQNTIKRILAHAVASGHAAASELPLLSSVTIEVRRRGAFSDDERMRLLDRLEQRIGETIYQHHQAGRRLLWLYVRFILLTGLRPGVESDLTFKDIEFKPGAHPHYVVRVRAGKTGPRPVIASVELGPVLHAIRAQHPAPNADALLWVKPNGKATARFGAQFFALMKELGMARDAERNARTLYSLRHTYITDRLNANVSVDKVALNCGTSVAMVQRHYGHVLIADHAQELTKLRSPTLN